MAFKSTLLYLFLLAHIINAQQPTQPGTQQPAQSATQPGTQQPAQPTTQPGAQQPTQPATQPGTQQPTQPAATQLPGTQQPAQTATQPGTQQPAQPATQPGTQQQPAQTTTQPGIQQPTQPATQPGTQQPTQQTTQPPTQQPTRPGTQPATQPATQPGTQPATTFDIGKYGGKPNTNIDEALLNAWKEACNATTPSTVVVPAGTFLLNQIKFVGPCKAPIELQVQGTIKAPLDYTLLPDKKGEWITFRYIDHLTISGGGVFDGQGQEAWTKNDCGKNPNCVRLPLNLSFNFITNSTFHDVTTKDSKNFHANVIGCKNVTFQHFTISAPGDSLNTDGLHIAKSEGIYVLDSEIKTGDDCISVGDGMKELHIERVTCGPGHGISVGSLGKGVTEEDVTGIYVKNCTFIGTQNGIRIKTWPSAPAKLRISDLHYEDIIMDKVESPIVIDQEYCPYNLCKLDTPSLIKISNMTVKNVKGTSAGAVAISFVCSQTVPCENVEIGDVDLAYVGTQGPITTKCSNIKPTFVGKQNPPICAANATQSS